MNALVDKNINQSHLLDPDEIHIVELPSNKPNASFFLRVIQWLHLTRLWRGACTPEVCIGVDNPLMFFCLYSHTYEVTSYLSIIHSYV
jgi:hypothetical protein